MSYKKSLENRMITNYIKSYDEFSEAIIFRLHAINFREFFLQCTKMNINEKKNLENIKV